MNWYRKIKNSDSPFPNYEDPNVDMDPEINKERSGFEYVENIMTEEDARQQQKKYPGLVFQGAGAYGAAFAYNDKIVVKYTSDSSEYMSAMELMGMQKSQGRVPGLVSVIAAEELQNGVYAIVMEKLELLNEQEKRFVDLMYYFREYIVEDFEDDVVFAQLRDRMEIHDDVYRNINLQSPEFISTYKKYKNMLLQINSVGGNSYDAHEYNIGKLPNGDYVMLDLGSVFAKNYQEDAIID